MKFKFNFKDTVTPTKNIKNKMTPTLRLFVILMLIGLVNDVFSKPIVTATTGTVVSKPANGSADPKVVDITLPLSLSTPEDLINWATYAIRVMASKINVTINHMNETKSLLNGNMYTKDLIPKMETIVQKIMKQIPKIKALPTKSTYIQQDVKFKAAETVPRGFEQLPTTTTVKPGNSRSFDVYPKLGDPRYPYNPFAGVFFETLPHVNPFVRYAPSVINNYYEPSGTRIFPEHAIFPGVGYLPLSNKQNPFSVTPTKNTSRTTMTEETTTEELSTEATTVATTMVELSSPEKIRTFNDAFKLDTETTTLRPIITVPFEAYITITRDGSAPPAKIMVTGTPAIPQNSLTEQTMPDSYSTINNHKNSDYFSTTVRDPPDDFPPYFMKGDKLEALPEDDEDTTTERNTSIEVGKKERSKLKTKKKQQNSTIEQTLIKLVVPRKKGQNDNSNSKEEPPIIRIVNERKKKLKEQQNKKVF